MSGQLVHRDCGKLLLSNVTLGRRGRKLATFARSAGGTTTHDMES